MRLLLTLACCIALSGVALAEKPKEQKKKRSTNATQPQQQEVQQQKSPTRKQQRHLDNQQQHAQHQLKKENRHEANQAQREQHQLNKEGRHAANRERKVRKFENLAKGPKRDVATVKFKENNRIVGSEKWVGTRYTVFRNYRARWHDRDWWHRHHTRIVLIGGGWYFWNAGFWFPAWGYDPGYSYYPYDGPIYGYNDLPPDQVIANVQAALQEDGYYQGEVDGLLGPLTRAALADYQRDHGLYTTAAIDEPTLDSLGLT